MVAAARVGREMRLTKHTHRTQTKQTHRTQTKHTEHRLNTQNTVEAERQRVATHKTREETHLLKGNNELSEPFSLIWLAQLLSFCSFFLQNFSALFAMF